MDSERIAQWLFADRIPATKLIIVSNAATFFAVVLFKAGVIVEYLAYSSADVLSQPWSLATYPLVGVSCSPICLVFACYWLWLAGGSLERSWGTRVFLQFLGTMFAVSILGLFAGGQILDMSTSAAGLWLPLAGVTVAFAMLNPEEQIRLMCVIPLKLKYLAMLSVAFVLVSYGQRHVLLGVFALSGTGFSYWLVRSGMQLAFGSHPGRERRKVVRVHMERSVFGGLNPLKGARRRHEEAELRRLFERSELDDGDST